jgi:hypothetical protein
MKKTFRSVSGKYQAKGKALLLAIDLALDTLMTPSGPFSSLRSGTVPRYCTPRRSRTNSTQATSGTVAVSSTS